MDQTSFMSSIFKSVILISVTYISQFLIRENLILAALAKFLKATFSFFMYVPLSVCLSVHQSAWNNSAPTGRSVVKFDVCVFLKPI